MPAPNSSQPVFRGRNLPSNVIAHALADSLGLLAIYFNLVA